LSPFGNYAGQEFGALTAIRPSLHGRWLFQCRCGAFVERKAGEVREIVRRGYVPACEACAAKNKQRVNLEDFTGQKFGLLTAIQPTGLYRGSFQIWDFRCQCGKIVRRVPADVRAVVARGHIAACPDCRKPSRTLDTDETVIRRIYHQYQNGARRRHLEFSLTIDELKVLIAGNCYYCGAQPSRHYQRGPKSHSLLVNGIDRMNNAIGYTTENVVSCCWRCNRAKCDMPLSDWNDWLDHIWQQRQIQHERKEILEQA
jgi:hypothetical protein